MAREEVKVIFTGIAHDHMMASAEADAMHQYQMRHHHHVSNNHNHNHHHHQQQQHHHHHHRHQTHLTTPQNYQHHVQPLSGRMAAENLSRHQEELSETKRATKQANDHKDDATALSTIAILRRHPMYDSLVLVKKYRPCLSGYSLEFPTSNERKQQREATGELEGEPSTENEAEHGCGRTKLVSVYLDGDDPIYQSQQNKQRLQNGANGQSEGGDGEMVYVPVNGLLDRLNNYDRHGIAIDSRVYAFAMGLKTAERFLTSSTVKEMQEAPPL